MSAFGRGDGVATIMAGAATDTIQPESIDSGDMATTVVSLASVPLTGKNESDGELVQEVTSSATAGNTAANRGCKISPFSLVG